MTFLNPLVLFGLAAAAIPILLHLFNLRKLKTVEFSTLSFLKELQKTRIRRVKIRQLLLLLLRMMLVILLVLAFARPTLRGSMVGSIGPHSRTTAVLIVDDSFSMAASDEDGEYLKQALQAAGGVVDLLGDGDEAYLVRLSEVRGRIGAEPQSPTRDFPLLKRELLETKASSLTTGLEEALRYSAKLLARSSNFNKEVYLISDFQSGVVRPEGDRPARRSPDALEPLFADETRFFFIPVGGRAPANFGIESIAIPGGIFEAGTPFTLHARIGNSSNEDARNHVVSVFLGGMRVAQRGIDIPAGASEEVEFSIASTETGFIEGFVELEDDDLQFDNRRYFVVHIPERIRVLLVGMTEDLTYLRAVLQTRLEGGSSERSAQAGSPEQAGRAVGAGLDLRETTPDKLTTAQLTASDVVLLANVSSFSSAQTNQIASFLDAGGGLVYFPGQAVEAQSFNTTIAAALKIPTISRIDPARDRLQESETSSFVEFDNVDLRHPLFQGVFIPEQDPLLLRGGAGSARTRRSVESPRIRRSVHYAPTPEAHPVITLSNGAPFLLDQPVGSGRVLLFSVPADRSWSDFPLRGLFVPLIHRSLTYLAAEQFRPGAGQREIIAGDEVTLRARIRATGQWTVQNPERVEEILTAVSAGTIPSVRFAATTVPGIYTVRAGPEIIRKFAVNVAAAESRTMVATAEEKAEMLKRLGIDPARTTSLRLGGTGASGRAGDLQRIVLESRFGVELWKHLLVAALLVALAEMAVARVGKREQIAERSS